MYSGHGTQAETTARRLMAADPVFAAEAARCASILGVPLDAALAGDAAPDTGDLAVAQGLIVATQLALTAALGAAGIVPDVVAGHSVGEVSAAVAAGKLDLATGLRVLRARNDAVAGRSAAARWPRWTAWRRRSPRCCPKGWASRRSTARGRWWSRGTPRPWRRRSAA